MGQSTAVSGPDLGLGVSFSEIPEAGVLAGHVDGTPVLLSRRDGALYAVSGSCSHYGAPLSEGLVEGDTVHCPWHHACFSLRTGEALKAPAFAPLTCWHVDHVGDRVFVRTSAVKIAERATPPSLSGERKRIVLVGGGAAAFACAERLRGRGFDGSLTMLSADDTPPCDRPNLSKDYLAGTAPEDWIPLRGAEFYIDHDIDLHLGCEVKTLDINTKRLTTSEGAIYDFDALLLATGAEPIKPSLPGFDHENVFTLRSLTDASTLIARLASASTVAVIGAGFIGLEAAAAMRARGLVVHVVAPESLPLARLLGEELATHFTELHRNHGIEFHLGCQAVAYDGEALLLTDGSSVRADAVLVGIGVKPRIMLASAAGLRIDDGILVDSCLRTSAPQIFAAGDVARYPGRTGLTRIEHWVHAQRQGQTVADNMLGDASPFTDSPFFWTHHYGTELRYLGDGRGWNSTSIEGSIEEGNCLVRYFRDEILIAAATIGRDTALLSLKDSLTN